MLALRSAVVFGTNVAAIIAAPVSAQNTAAQTPPVEQAQSTPPVQTAQPQPQSQPPAQAQPKPVVAPAAKPKSAARRGPVDSLKPGQFVWEKRESYINPLRMVIVLDIQRMYVFDGDELVGFSTISSGKKGKETPTGIFKILQKKEYHESNLYANAPMPFMQRLTWDGIAIHAGHLPGYPASHGCIRLPKVFAKSLYEVTQMDGEVVVLASLDRPKPESVPPPPTTEVPPPVETPPVEPTPPTTAEEAPVPTVPEPSA